jgi:hypothetical protein
MKNAFALLLALTFSSFSLFCFSQNVGIGNPNPTLGKLEIYGASNGSQLLSSSGANSPGFSLSTPFGLSPSLGFNVSYGNAFRFMSAGYGAMIQYSPSSGLLYFNTSQTKGLPGEASFFNSNTVAIDSNGYLGIGTTAPKAKLHVNSSMVIGNSTVTPAAGYLLSIDGKMICEEIKVQMNTAWPDYVFENDYALIPLAELEQKVMKEKHLPGIPAAGDISAANGIELGDMQKRLLEKMEELYRYVFELNRQNQELKKEIDLLKKPEAKTE